MDEHEAKSSFSKFSELAGQVASGLPVLVYHKVAERPRRAKWRSLYCSPQLFARQMVEFAAAGFRTTALGAPRPASGNPERQVAVTFDDGYENVLIHAAPVLQRLNYRAIEFLVSDALGGTNHWDVREGEVPERLMDAAQVREWLSLGHEIGSHTVSHPRLTQLPRERAREELYASKCRLEDLFGVPVRHFCYPYGEVNAAVADLVGACGYETACTLRGGVNAADTPRYWLRRIEGRYAKRSPKALWQRFVRRWLPTAARPVNET